MELVRCKSTKHADHAVVAADRMEAEWKARHPEAGGGQPAASEIADEHSVARHPMQLRENRSERLLREMVDDLGRDDQIHRGSRQGQREDRAADEVTAPLADGRGQFDRNIDRHRSGPAPRLTQCRADGVEDVPRSGANVHDEGRLGQAWRDRPHAGQYGACAAEQRVGARDIDM